MSSRTVHVGLLGCGHVGSALVRQISDHGAAIEARTGIRLEVTRVAVRNLARERDVPIAASAFTHDAASVVVADDVDVVVEVIGGIEPARELIVESLKAGKPVVTANKELLANVGRELFETAESAGVDLLFEASVAGGIPLMRPLRESLAGDRIRRVLGIVNGTTNYILSRMAESGATFSDALAEAQGLGYAERDPTADVEGFDAAAKTAIIASIAFGARVVAGDVYREGISAITDADIRSAAELGYAVKLLAVAEENDDGVAVRVHPMMVPVSHPLASVRDSFNALVHRGRRRRPAHVLRPGCRRRSHRERGARRRDRRGQEHRQWRARRHRRHARPASPSGPSTRSRASSTCRSRWPTARVCSRRSPSGSVRTRCRSSRCARSASATKRASSSSPTVRRRPPRARRATRWASSTSCTRSGEPLRVLGDAGVSARVTAIHRPWPGLIEAYREYLPVTDSTPVVTLLEGNTPLVPAPRLSEELGLDVHLKVEGANPTGSFKDRGMTMAITKAVEEGAKVVVCASTGNTSASAAAYAARAGITCAVVIPEGKIALGKLAQALIHGAQVVQIRGNFDQALDVVRALGDVDGVSVVNSINPYRIEGQKTASFEIVEALGDAPDVHCLPVGNAGNITAYWKGYAEYETLGHASRRPRMLGWQAQGAAPLVLGEPVLHPETIATAIRIGNPASWVGADRGPRPVGRRDRHGQ